MVGVFAATDVFLFYVFFEAMLVPVYFLIGRYGGPRRSYAAVKFLLYSLFGGLLMLAALIGLYVVSADQLGTGTFDFTQLAALSIDPTLQKWLFTGFFIAFAIKAPLVPFHTWLPDAAAESTPGTAVLLVGVLDKVGTFGMLRYCLELFPDASHWATPLVIALAVVGIIYGALLAIGQTDIKRLIAYTSVSHFGFIALGVFVMTTQGQSGSALYMVNHGFSTAALFLIGGFLISRRGSRLIDDFGGVQKVAPVLAGTFLVAGLSSLALPGLSSFVSEFLVLVGTFERYTWVGVIATLGIVLAALYILLMYQRTMTGPVSDDVAEKAVFLMSDELHTVREEDSVDVNQIRELIKVVEASDISEIVIEEGDAKITVRRGGLTSSASAPAAASTARKPWMRAWTGACPGSAIRTIPMRRCARASAKWRGRWWR